MITSLLLTIFHHHTILVLMSISAEVQKSVTLTAIMFLFVVETHPAWFKRSCKTLSTANLIKLPELYYTNW